MLDVECSVRGCSETYVQKVKVQHKENKKLFEPKHCDQTRTFGIHHYAGPVVYDTSQFLDTNRDVIPDDLVCVFARENCQFGFASHLFGNEIKSLSNGRHGDAFPRGACFRISSTSASHINGNSDTLLNGDEPVSTLTQDFHTRLDNLLRTLVHAKPHFVRCIRPNEHDSLTEFDRSHVASQVRSLQILETVNLMAGGFPHRMRFKAFNARYKVLAHPMRILHRTDEKAVDDCELILDCYSRNLKDLERPNDKYTNNRDWAHGRKHVFLSEGARQQLEMMRDIKRNKCATKIQSTWRGYLSRRKLKVSSMVNRSLNNNIFTNNGTHHHNQTNLNNMFVHQSRGPRPKPISGTPPPLDIMHSDRCDFKTIQQTCSLFGLDLVS
jgi:dachs protein